MTGSVLYLYFLVTYRVWRRLDVFISSPKGHTIFTMLCPSSNHWRFTKSFLWNYWAALCCTFFALWEFSNRLNFVLSYEFDTVQLEKYCPCIKYTVLLLVKIKVVPVRNLLHVFLNTFVWTAFAFLFACLSRKKLGLSKGCESTLNPISPLLTGN